jgi:hypothetical protein
MMEENIHLKNRLSELLKDKFDKNLLEEVESFQNSFLKEDDLIGILRDDVAELDKLLVRQVFEDKKINNEIEKRMTKLRYNIITAETQFGKLKSAFNNYLLEIDASNKKGGKLLSGMFEIIPRMHIKPFS